MQAVPYYRGEANLDGDVHLYAEYASQWAAGRLPYRDFHIEYPPGVLPFLHLPFPNTRWFEVEFVALALLADLAIWALLAKYRTGARAGWLWIATGAALGSIMWVRLDVFVALFLIAGCIAAERRAYALCGVLLAAAALVKLWPVILIASIAVAVRERRHAVRMLTAAGLTTAAVVTPLIAAGAGSGMLWVLHYHSARGLEIEAVPTLPIHFARLMGAAVPATPGFGSIEFGGPRWAHLTLACGVATYFAWLGCVLLARRYRLAPASALMLLVAATVLTSKVLSPQYFVWAIAAAALVLDVAPDPRRLFAWSLLAGASTQVVFPFLFIQLVQSQRLGEAAVLMHIALVVAFAAVAIHAVLRSLSGAPDLRLLHQPGPTSVPVAVG